MQGRVGRSYVVYGNRAAVDAIGARSTRHLGVHRGCGLGWTGPWTSGRTCRRPLRLGPAQPPARRPHVPLVPGPGLSLSGQSVDEARPSPGRSESLALPICRGPLASESHQLRPGRARAAGRGLPRLVKRQCQLRCLVAQHSLQLWGGGRRGRVWWWWWWWGSWGGRVRSRAWAWWWWWWWGGRGFVPNANAGGKNSVIRRLWHRPHFELSSIDP